MSLYELIDIGLTFIFGLSSTIIGVITIVFLFVQFSNHATKNDHPSGKK